MAEVKARCAYMENAFPASKFRVKNDMSAVPDASGEHMIFAREHDGTLVLVLKGPIGNNEVVNLNKRFGLTKKQSVKSFAVAQNSDLVINLVLVVQERGKADKLIAVRPTVAKYSAWTDSEGASELLMKSPDPNDNSEWDLNIREVLLSTSNNPSEDHSRTTYPQLHITCQDRSEGETEDVWSVSADIDEGTLVRQDAFEMPCNSGAVIDKCAANLGDWRGLYVLYRETDEDGSTLQMRFVGLDVTKENPSLRSVDISVPDGACALAAYQNRQGSTDLLVRGDKLTWLGSQIVMDGDSPSPSVLKVGAGEAYAGVVRLVVAQSETTFSLWSLDGESNLSYQEFSIPKSAEKRPTMVTDRMTLLGAGEASNVFTALQNPKSGQMLFIVDKNDQLLMLAQDSYTALWRDGVPIAIPDREDVIEFSSFTVGFQISGLRGDPTLHHLRLRCSTTSELIVNGRTRRGTPTGIRVAPDVAGMITVIIRSENELSAPILTLDKWKEDVLAAPFAYDPAAVIWSKLKGIKTGRDLRRLKMPDGSSVVDPSVSAKDLDKVAESVSKLIKIRNNLLSDKDSDVSDIVVRRPEPEPSLIQRVWGWFKWIGQKIVEGLDWVIEKVGPVWNFVVEIRGKVIKFIMQTVQQTLSAAWSMLKFTLKSGWRLNKFLLSPFTWPDIIDVKNIFVNMTTRMLLQGVDGVAYLHDQVDKQFEQVKSEIRQLSPDKLHRDLKNQDMSEKAGKSLEATTNASDENTDMSSSPQGYYGAYHLRHSGGMLQATGNPFQMMLNSFGDIFEELTELGSDLVKVFERLFTRKTNMTVPEILGAFGVKLVERLLNLVQKLVLKMLKIFEEIVLTATELLNEPVNVPVISWLYRKASGKELTLLDAVCLVLAIPATFVFKSVTDQRPCELGDGVTQWLDTEETFAELRARRERRGKSSSRSKAPRRNEVFSNINIFMEDTKVIYPLLSIGTPLAGGLWWVYDTWGGAVASSIDFADAVSAMGFDVRGTLMTFSGDFLIFALSVNGVFDFTKTFEEQMNDPSKHGSFLWGFWCWLSGVVPIVAGLFGGKIGTVATLGVEVFQVLALAKVHSMLAGTKDFDLPTVVEEWLKLIGDLAVAVMPLVKAPGSVMVAKAALLTRGAGNSMNMSRAIKSIEDQKESKSNDGSDPPKHNQTVMG